ncbi:MAG: hypothetical protein RIS76_3692 [Verrucomicrobiota bacterium]
MFPDGRREIGPQLNRSVWLQNTVGTGEDHWGDRPMGSENRHAILYRLRGCVRILSRRSDERTTEVGGDNAASAS